VKIAIYSPSGASAGVGFAVPVDTVNRVVPQLIARGKYASPSLGIEIDQNLNDLLTSRLEVRGVLVLRVIPGSAAAAAGLKGALLGADGTFTPGDLITAIDGKPVDDVQQLLARLDDFQVGDPVSITLLRDGRVMERKVILQGE
jgi:S1-C subfamily serine protease